MIASLAHDDHLNPFAGSVAVTTRVPTNARAAIVVSQRPKVPAHSPKGPFCAPGCQQGCAKLTKALTIGTSVPIAGNVQTVG